MRQAMLIEHNDGTVLYSPDVEVTPNANGTYDIVPHEPWQTHHRHNGAPPPPSPATALPEA